MTIAGEVDAAAGGAPARKPRIALMGEFSAGKSTLTNLLIGAHPLPVRVTATQLPPVWISWGDATPYRVDLAGAEHPVDIEALDGLPPEDTRVIRIFQKSDMLELCDLIDMPGISDPNMSPDVWQRVVGEADAVIWCSHATQAWRQSEAAVWESLAPELRMHSLLLLTRIDKILGDKDRSRVLRRVRHETAGLFAEVFPISLTEAVAAGDDRDRWESSGAEAFTTALVDILHGLQKALGSVPDDPLDRPLAEDMTTGVPEPVPATPTRVVPRRVNLRPSRAVRTPRPDRDTAAAMRAGLRAGVAEERS
jgi:hypothetical protein